MNNETNFENPEFNEQNADYLADEILREKTEERIKKFGETAFMTAIRTGLAEDKEAISKFFEKENLERMKQELLILMKVSGEGIKDYFKTITNKQKAALLGVMLSTLKPMTSAFAETLPDDNDENGSKFSEVVKETEGVFDTDKWNNWLRSDGGIDFDGDGEQDPSVKWEVNDLNKTNDDKYLWYNFRDSIPGGTGGKPFKELDEKQNLTPESLLNFARETLLGTSSSSPAALIAEYAMYGTLLGETVEDGEKVDLKSYYYMLDFGEEGFANDYRKKTAKELNDYFAGKTIVCGKAPEKYYTISIKVGSPKTDYDFGTEKINTTTDYGEKAKEGRNWIDVKSSDGKLYYDDNEYLRRLFIEEYKLPEDVDLEIHFGFCGVNQPIAWVKEKEKPTPTEYTIIDQLENGDYIVVDNKDPYEEVEHAGDYAEPGAQTAPVTEDPGVGPENGADAPGQPGADERIGLGD